MNCLIFFELCNFQEVPMFLTSLSRVLLYSGYQCLWYAKFSNIANISLPSLSCAYCLTHSMGSSEIFLKFWVKKKNLWYRHILEQGDSQQRQSGFHPHSGQTGSLFQSVVLAKCIPVWLPQFRSISFSYFKVQGCLPPFLWDKPSWSHRWIKPLDYWSPTL